ncbi:hypothetical protein AgCh_030493 [Apium graveolens]
MDLYKGGASFPRAYPPHQNLPSGHVTFRLLCHASRIGSVIGKSGSIIKHLQHETSARIRVDESPAPPKSGDRVIIITASSSITRKVVFSDEEIEVSAAQEAVVRVFEKILDVAVEELGLVSCRLLAEQSHAGSVIGKGGKVVEKIRKETGSKIRVLSSEKLPACASRNDEMIEIEGDFVAVKKALIAVSRCLQDSPPVGRVHDVDQQEIRADGRMDVPPVRSFVPQPNSGSSLNHAPGRPFSSDADHHLNTSLIMSQEEVTFRILCPHERVGVVIGKQGMVVRALQNESGASINVASPVPDCKERLVTITATENAESQSSAAQNAVILVFNKSTDSGYSKGIDSGGKRSHVAAQVVVSSNQVGCLLGKGGAIISEMRRATGAYMRIIGGGKVPKCVPENYQVVQITGDFASVQEALFTVTGRLRDIQFSNKGQNGAGMRNGGHRLTTLTQRMSDLGLSHNLDGSPQTGAGINSRSVLDNGKELNSVNGVVEHGRLA